MLSRQPERPAYHSRFCRTELPSGVSNRLNSARRSNGARIARKKLGEMEANEPGALPRYIQPSWARLCPSFQILVICRIRSPSNSMT